MPAGHYRPEVAMLHHKEKMQGEVLHLWDRKIELQQKGDNPDQKIKCRPLSDVLVEHLSIFPRDGHPWSPFGTPWSSFVSPCTLEWLQRTAWCNFYQYFFLLFTTLGTTNSIRKAEKGDLCQSLLQFAHHSYAAGGTEEAAVHHWVGRTQGPLHLSTPSLDKRTVKLLPSYLLLLPPHLKPPPPDLAATSWNYFPSQACIVSTWNQRLLGKLDIFPHAVCCYSTRK